MRAAFAVLLVLLAVSGSAVHPSHAAVQVPHVIRVGLFLNLPSKNFASLTPVATLTSDAGLSILWRGASGFMPIASSAPGRPVRFSMDGYRAIVLETSDLNGALAVRQHLQALTPSVFVTQLTKRGKPVYQVSEGVYPTAAGAAAALTQWRGVAASLGVPASADPRIAGPHAVEAGPYASRDEAAAAAAQIGNAGLDTFVAVKAKDGVPAYYVRIGQEADNAGLAALQQTAAAAGALQARVPDPAEPYAVIRNDLPAGSADGSPVPLYAVSNNGGAVLRAESADSSPIRLTERSNRQYRGAMEISVFNQALAVVNEVSLEQYLYSVVGAEVGADWPPEAQKAQAVAARSYALSSGRAFQIVDVVDTTLSQVYAGIASENPNSTAGVNATAGEVLTYGGQIISAVFSSNAGGVTADNRTEVWGNDTPYLSGGTPSPDDGPREGLPDWYDVVLPSGQRGYVRSDLLMEAGRNAAGLRLLAVAENGTAVRIRPKVEAGVEPIARLNQGTTVLYLRQVPENSAYTWVEAPKKPDELLASLKKYFPNLTGRLQTMEVTGTGPSGRVTEISVNGTPLALKSPDSWRGALGGIRSTLLTIEETGRMTIEGAGGAVRDIPREGDAGSVQVIGADGAVRPASGDPLIVIDASGQVRAVSKEPSFILSVKGYGHGLGMSQYGAKKLAEQGNDYRYILQYYYTNAVLEKDADG